jgi:glutamyl-tRNA reductase
MPFVVAGISHKTAPVSVREKLAFPEAEITAALGRMKSSGVATEAVVLSTCNRVELYATGHGDLSVLSRRVRAFLGEDRGFDGDLVPVTYTHADTAALEHLFRVASGLDSLVLGETEILGQLKKSYSVALESGHTGGVLNKAFQRAFSVAKRVRTETQIQRGNTSVAAVAVDLAERIFDNLADREVLVIGAGDTSEKTARALLSRGARSILVSNRTFDRAAALAEELGGRAIHFDEWEREFSRVDIVVSATGAPHYILDRPKLERLLRPRGNRPLLLVDLAVPRDIDPVVTMINDVFLANVDDLQAVADSAARQRREELARCEEMIRTTAAEFQGGRRFGPFGVRSPVS